MTMDEDFKNKRKKIGLQTQQKQGGMGGTSLANGAGEQIAAGSNNVAKALASRDNPDYTTYNTKLGAGKTFSVTSGGREAMKSNLAAAEIYKSMREPKRNGGDDMSSTLSQFGKRMTELQKAQREALGQTAVSKHGVTYTPRAARDRAELIGEQMKELGAATRSIISKAETPGEVADRELRAQQLEIQKQKLGAELESDTKREQFDLAKWHSEQEAAATDRSMEAAKFRLDVEKAQQQEAKVADELALKAAKGGREAFEAKSSLLEKLSNADALKALPEGALQSLGRAAVTSGVATELEVYRANRKALPTDRLEANLRDLESAGTPTDAARSLADDLRKELESRRGTE